MSKILPFRWYGGKYSHLNWLLPLLPKTKRFCEPFGGSAAVLINREPAEVETYNDLDGDVVNFFKILRDQKEELLEKIALTPFSREEFKKAIEKKGNKDLSDLERARLFFVRAGQARTGLAQEATPGRWAYCVKTSRRDMSGAVSRYHGRLKQLKQTADRLRRVQIENLPAIKVIRKYDSEETLFYCDPPYPHESRGDPKAYGYEMSDKEHRELAEVLHAVDGKVALSSYKCDLMNELYGGWNRIDAKEKTNHSSKGTRQESLWVNYSPSKQKKKEVKQKSLTNQGSK